MSLQIAKSYNELIKEAKEIEQEGDFIKASKLYERIIKMQPHDEFAYNRLMIIYRKLRMYEDELRIIEKGVSVFKNQYKKKAKKIMSKNKTAEKLSKSLAKALGLTDKKGTDLFQPEPIAKWTNRKAVVEKKLGK